MITILWLLRAWHPHTSKRTFQLAFSVVSLSYCHFMGIATFCFKSPQRHILFFYVVVLAILHIYTALSYKPASTVSDSFICSCYMRTKNISSYDSIEISAKRVVAPSQYDCRSVD